MAGWAVTLGLLGALAAATRFVPGEVQRIVIYVALIAAFGVVAANKTDGGLRWRWGPRRDH